MVRSYELLPIGLPTWEFGNLKNHLVYAIGSTFDIALRLSFPVMISMLTVYVIMAVISRTAPQMNLFFNVSFIVNLATGFMLVAITFPQMLMQVKRFSERLLSFGYGVF